MAEMFNFKRVVFPKGGQKDFIGKVAEKIPTKEMAKICRLSERTIRDWRREKFSIDLFSLRRLCRAAKLSFPGHVKMRDRYWYAGLGAVAGGRALIKKYGRIPGDLEYRKKRWREWWEKEGRRRKHPIIGVSKPIRNPSFSKELAEFVGIMLGDGGVSKYQVYITLNSEDDKKYSEFVDKLIKKLFKVPVRKFLRRDDSTIRLVISRIDLVRFCVQKGGLKIGNKVKQQVDIPKWIKDNKTHSVACLRGLIDTNGCVFIHRYVIHGKKYVYKKISFTSYSRPLIYSVFKILKNLNIRARITKNRQDVKIDAQKDVKKYAEVVGFHNQKNLKKYQN